MLVLETLTNEQTAFLLLYIFGKVIEKKSAICEEKFTLYTVPCSNVSSSSDSETEEPDAKRIKISGTDENFHRDDPQIGVCLECLGYVSQAHASFNLIVTSFVD